MILHCSITSHCYMKALTSTNYQVPQVQGTRYVYVLLLVLPACCNVLLIRVYEYESQQQSSKLSYIRAAFNIHISKFSRTRHRTQTFVTAIDAAITSVVPFAFEG